MYISIDEGVKLIADWREMQQDEKTRGDNGSANGWELCNAQLRMAEPGHMNVNHTSRRTLYFTRP